ncbi:helix-turn-helix domain-containing protein [Streptomyces antibioticus]|uniref:helix-turn-helix domain-containing protein n=1 Tax=Streptomyces antibioticus TaxID=1890 RepID=UPI0037A7FEA9
MTESVLSVGAVVAEQVRRYRQARGWSVRRLAEECARVGAARLTQSSLANIERGQRPEAERRPREVTVDELMALSAALGVPLTGLLLPFSEEHTDGRIDTDADHVAVTPAYVVDWYTYTSWLTGRTLLSHEERERGTNRHWHDSVNLMDAVRRYQESLRNEQDWYDRRIETELREPDSAKAQTAHRLHEDAVEQVLDALRTLLGCGISPPPVDPRVVEAVKERGWALRPEVRKFLGLEETADGDRL